ncbi:MAG: L,D-transpeptidase family protein [Clostridia bacterium]|nr:L,D-transpeptidase family protein [Clostridia bacterium]
MQKIIAILTDNTCALFFKDKLFHGYCGQQGGNADKIEGDRTTPLGIFPIRYGFYREIRPKTVLPMVKITSFHHFIDQPCSPCYNRLVYGKPRHHAEAMEAYKEEYAFGMVIEYNRDPVIKGKGSAVFIHCGSHPTAGCLAFAKEDMLALLESINRLPLVIQIIKEESFKI